ncbi:hypothetical protein [Salinithrix halophila]|uniref:Fur-regulated basic protein A n=1 Tax=Salinithrix halophila TaxID=1485204 RepID=A0ABV8JH95_9BACL
MNDPKVQRDILYRLKNLTEDLIKETFDEENGEEETLPPDKLDHLHGLVQSLIDER